MAKIYSIFLSNKYIKAMATYTKSLATDFGGDLKESQFHTEIDVDAGITPNLVGVHVTGDVVEIEFDSALSAGEQTTLDGLVSAHTPDNSKPRIQFYTVAPRHPSIKSSSYFLCLSFRYDGSDTVGPIDYLDLTACKHPNITSYDVRVVDNNSGLVLVEKTGMTNTDATNTNLGALSNISKAPTILELQIKKNGGKPQNAVEIDQLVVYYGN